MKLLLTSAGLTNPVLVRALRDMLGKPTRASTIAIIPTAHNPESGDKAWMLHEDFLLPYQLGWGKFSVVDLAAVESLDRSHWWPQLEEADVLLVGGGNVFYLSYWMQKAGLFDVLPQWLESKVYVGISAGSQLAGSDLYASGEVLGSGVAFDDPDYDQIGPEGQSSGRTLRLVDFTLRPHLNSPEFPNIRPHYLREIAKTLKTPMYALDDNTAITVYDAQIDVVGAGEWHRFDPGS